MGHVFVLVLLIGGDNAGGSPMYFASVKTCNWYASQVVKRYGNHSTAIPKEHRATAYCKPKYLDKTKVTVYDH